MKLITKENLLKNIVKDWKFQYGDSSPEITQKLQSLEDPTEEQVTAIIGNNSWMSNICDECGREVPVSVKLGEEVDETELYANAANICTICLQKALDLTKNNS